MATRTISVAGGNWNSTSAWDEGAVAVAGDAVVARVGGTSGNLTVNVASACTSLILTNYTGTLTFDAQLTVSGTVTFVAGCTLAGTTGPLVISSAAATITSGGKTIPCPLTFGATGTYTLADSWTVTGLVTAGVTTVSTTLNGAGKTLTCNGGFHLAGTTAGLAGTAKLTLGGGTWDAASTGVFAVDVDLAGNVTVSGGIIWGSGSKTLAYVSGTITTTGSTLTCGGTSTFNTAGVTWNNLTLNGSGVTYTLSSNLAWSGAAAISVSMTLAGAGTLSGTGSVTVTNPVTITLNNTGGLVTTGTLTLPNAAMTFAGSAGFTVGTLTTASLNASRTYTLTFGNTYTVTTSLSNVGTTTSVRQAIKSSSAGNKVVFNLTPGATQSLTYCDPTDVDSSGGGQVISFGGTITTSLNWSGSVVASTGYPALTDVRTGVSYGAGLTGTLAVPAASNVKTGVQYGAGGTEYTGTYTAAGGGPRIHF
jgi:fibronectin-binding autotransporter adhesin